MFVWHVKRKRIDTKCLALEAHWAPSGFRPEFAHHRLGCDQIATLKALTLKVENLRPNEALGFTI